MKLLLYVVLLIFITTSHQTTFSQITQIWQSYVLKHSEKCLQSTGADYNLAMRILPYGEFVDDRKLKCFFHCILDNLFAVYEDGSTHHSNVLELMNIKDLEILQKADIVNKCFEIKMPDPCDSAYALVECIHKTIKSIMDNN